MIVVAAVVTAECVVQESVLKGVNQKEFSHTRDCDEGVEEVNCHLIVQNRKSCVNVTAIGQNGYVVTGYTQARRILREHTKHEAWQSV